MDTIIIAVSYTHLDVYKRQAQSYCTAPGQSCWHHYWVHLDGAGVAAMEPLLLPDKKLTPVQLTGVRMQELFELVLEQMELGTVDSMVPVSYTHLLCALKSNLKMSNSSHRFFNRILRSN